MDQVPPTSVPSTISFGLSASITSGVLSISGYVSAGRCTCILTPANVQAPPGDVLNNAEQAPFSARIFFSGQDEGDGETEEPSAATTADKISESVVVTGACISSSIATTSSVLKCSKG